MPGWTRLNAVAASSPGGEAEHGVQQTLRGLSDKHQRQGADPGHQTGGQTRHRTHDENVRPGQRLDYLIHAALPGALE